MVKQTLWRVPAYLLPGFPRPTISQGSFSLGLVDSAFIASAVVNVPLVIEAAMTEDFPLKKWETIQHEDGNEIRGFEKWKGRPQLWKLIDDTEALIFMSSRLNVRSYGREKHRDPGISRGRNLIWTFNWDIFPRKERWEKNQKIIA